MILDLLAPALVAVIALYVVYYVRWQLTTGKTRRRIIRENGCLPARKYPAKDPIFGLDLFRGSIKALAQHNFMKIGQERFNNLGVNTFSANVLDLTLVFTIEPENLKVIQSLDFKNWGLPHRRAQFMGPLLGDGIFILNGARWHRSRELLRPNFARTQVADLQTFENHVKHLIHAIPRDGSTVDLQDLFFRLTMDSATELLFGESTNCLAPGTTTVSHQGFADAFNRAQDHAGKLARLGRFAALMPNPQYKKDCKFVHAFADSFVEKGLQRRKNFDTEKGEVDNRYVFLHQLVKETGDKLQIRSELLNILLAGRDTTASLLSNVWWQIARRPDVCAKLRAEVDQLDGIPPTFAQLKDMKYLRWVLNESLRLYPVVPANAREAMADTVLPLGGGPDGKSPLFIPKGRLVSWSLYTMHRRKDLYGDDAEDFRPERWDTLRPGWEYLPFNGGPRICLGQQYALTEASYTTIRLMQEFRDIESRDHGPWVEWLTLTCAGLGGAKVGLTPFQE